MNIIIITGSTATGKSKFANKLATKINSEIINIDSMQVYKTLEIITASNNLKKNIKHHLYGFLDPNFLLDVTFLINEIDKILIELEKKNINAIIVGGTPFYINVLINSISEIPKTKNIDQLNQMTRIEIEQIYTKLINIDPKIKDKINPNDVQRILRAYSVYQETGRSIFDFYNNKKPSIISKYQNIKKILLDIPKSEIVKNVENRIEKMINDGAIQEVQEFLDKYKNENYQSFTSYKAIGVKEIEDFLNNKINIIELKELIKQNTMKYVKHQKTWYKKFQDFELLTSDFEVDNFKLSI